jgi:hypothetical protein
MCDATSHSRGGTYEVRQRRAYRLYVGYKTQTLEYRSLAESFGLTTGQLNSQMCVIYNARLRARSARRAARGRATGGVT